MQGAHTPGHPTDFLLRAQHNHCSPQGDKLWTAVMGTESLGAIEFTLPDGHGGTMPVGCLIARETDAPPGHKTIEWRLLTNRTVTTAQGAAQLIDWYCCRWEIETLFHVLKNGCRVEPLQFGHINKLELAIYLVVAWWLAHLARICPDLPACVVFEQTEWQAAWLLAEKPAPRRTPSLREAIRRIAMLGDFLARKGDGEPGEKKTLWQGFTRLSGFVRVVEQMCSSHAG